MSKRCENCMYWSYKLGMCRNTQSYSMGQFKNKNAVCRDWVGGRKDERKM